MARSGKGATVRLRIALFAHYLTFYRLCATGPDRKTDCRRFKVNPATQAHCVSTVPWAKDYPFRGAGIYHATEKPHRSFGSWPMCRRTAAP